MKTYIIEIWKHILVDIVIRNRYDNFLHILIDICNIFKTSNGNIQVNINIHISVDIITLKNTRWPSIYRSIYDREAAQRQGVYRSIYARSPSVFYTFLYRPIYEVFINPTRLQKPKIMILEKIIIFIYRSKNENFDIYRSKNKF